VAVPELADLVSFGPEEAGYAGPQVLVVVDEEDGFTRFARHR